MEGGLKMGARVAETAQYVQAHPPHQNIRLKLVERRGAVFVQRLRSTPPVQTSSEQRASELGKRFGHLFCGYTSTTLEPEVGIELLAAEF
jgi:hypothetical protein